VKKNVEMVHVVLLDTNPKGLQGSMARYSDMVMDSLTRYSVREKFHISRIQISLPRHIIDMFPIRIRNWLYHLGLIVLIKKNLFRCKADIIHILDGSCAYVLKLLPNVSVVVTSHDVIPELQAKGFLGPSRPSGAGLWLIGRSLKAMRRVDHIIAVSKNTASDLCRIAGVSPEKIRVVYSAVAQEISERAASRPFPSWEERRLRGDAYILHVGNNSFYKNWRGVVNIFARIREKCAIRLVMACPVPGDQIRKVIEEKSLSETIDFIVEPDDARLVALYTNACLLLFPSLYEGFGWPPLEAMACGCPVVCSDAASLPEIAGDAALTCPPGDEQQFAEKCISILEDSSLASDLIKKGIDHTAAFTIEKMGRELIAVYKDVVNARSH
jgi:glycosyltransferase involved in cell wall biosynthesis